MIIGMPIPTFFRGFLIGLSIAAPVGPIGILCIRRTLANGMLSGLVSGLGAATADAFYAGLAALGMTFLIQVIIDQRGWMQVLGGIFLCYLGVKTFLEKPAHLDPMLASQANSNDVPKGEWKARSMDYLSTFFLTITNPLTILSFAAIFAGVGISHQGRSEKEGLIIVIGVFMGSCTWWLLLSLLTNIFRVRFMSEKVLKWINRISGALITSFGLVALGTSILF